MTEIEDEDRPQTPVAPIHPFRSGYNISVKERKTSRRVSSYVTFSTFQLPLLNIIYSVGRSSVVTRVPGFVVRFKINEYL